MTRVADTSSTTVSRLQPLRILLSGRDRRFVRVTSFLLSRRGYQVLETGPEGAIEAAERHRSDVVLLEMTDSRVAAARKVAALQALSTAPGVLVMFENDGEQEWNGLAGIEKWTPIDLLIDGIEAAARRRAGPSVDSQSRSA
jgi:CheY-like chemotaxis protein